MFCEKCGREIPEDSIYCAYCGIRLPPEVKASDWEEAARLRELQDSYQDKKAEKKDAAGRDVSHGSDCIRPGAPKKNCLDCGKELPASTIGKYCALCETRRNREAEERAEAAANRRLQQEEAKGLRDRYDVSDEFDWQVFQQNRPVSQKKPVRPKTPSQKPKRSLKKTLLLIIGILIAVRVLFNVFGMIIYFLVSNVSAPKAISEKEIRLPEVSSDTARIWIEGNGEAFILDLDDDEFAEIF